MHQFEFLEGDLVKRKRDSVLGLILGDEYRKDSPSGEESKAFGLYQVFWLSNSKIESLVPSDTIDLINRLDV
jgi:hypothetical protein|tara:strand:- start:203 stop:418 length:216 start_codon:yes stop_codon:yes gene_type:complete